MEFLLVGGRKFQIREDAFLKDPFDNVVCGISLLEEWGS